MVSEKCWQCNGSGKQTFHKGTPREYEADCPCCGGNKLKNDKSKELSSEVKI